MLEQKTWKEFKDTGLFWWINSILHIFGGAIIVYCDDNGNINNSYQFTKEKIYKITVYKITEELIKNNYGDVKGYYFYNLQELNEFFDLYKFEAYIEPRLPGRIYSNEDLERVIIEHNKVIGYLRFKGREGK